VVSLVFAPSHDDEIVKHCAPGVGSGFPWLPRRLSPHPSAKSAYGWGAQGGKVLWGRFIAGPPVGPVHSQPLKLQVLRLVSEVKLDVIDMWTYIHVLEHASNSQPLPFGKQLCHF